MTWLSGSAPMKPSTGWPLTKAITAGIDWMPIWPGNLRMLVDVHLGELDLALGGLHRLFQHRRELLAGAAPGRPEIHQHRLALGFLDHVLHEGLRGRVLDHVGRRPPPLRRFAASSCLASARRRRISMSLRIRWVIRLPNAIGSGGSAGRPETRSIRGLWPVDSRNFTRSSRAMRRGHGVDQRMKLSVSCSIMAASSTTVTRPCRVVDGAERRHRTGLHAQTSRSRSAEPNEKRPLAPSSRCRPLRSISASSSATTRKSAFFLSRRNRFLVWPPGDLAAQALRLLDRK